MWLIVWNILVIANPASEGRWSDEEYQRSEEMREEGVLRQVAQLPPPIPPPRLDPNEAIRDIPDELNDAGDAAEG